MLIHVLYVLRVISLRPPLHLIYQSTQSIFSLSIGSGNQQIDPYVCAGPLPYLVNYTVRSKRCGRYTACSHFSQAKGVFSEKILNLS